MSPSVQELGPVLTFRLQIMADTSSEASLISDWYTYAQATLYYFDT